MSTTKKALIFGVANERSLAWAIALDLKKMGYELGFTYAGEAIEKRVKPLAQEIGATLVEPCDVTKDSDISQVFEKVKAKWGTLDVVIHSVAFANREDLDGRFIDTSREGFRLALDISAYSLIGVARAAEPLFGQNGGTVITLSYYGSQVVIQNYNIMGVAKAALEASVRYLAFDLGAKKVRVNAISAGPVKTLAAAGIRGFRDTLGSAGEKNPLKENITAEDVGALAAFLCGEGGKHITGATMYVDSGTHIMGPY